MGKREKAKMSDVENPATEKSKLNEETSSKANNSGCYTKEELLELSDTPGWNMARRVLLILFWISWFGMIAWSVLIIVQAPKCKPEPVQASFTQGALARLDCSLSSADLVASVEDLDHGKFQGVVLSKCDAGSEEKIGEVLGAANAKNIKAITSIDAVDLDAYDYSAAGESTASGIILLNVDSALVLSNIPDEFDVFTESSDPGVAITGDHYWFKSVSSVSGAKAWLAETVGAYNQTEPTPGVEKWAIDSDAKMKETLWIADDFNSVAQVALTGALPGGFVFPVDMKDDYSELSALRGQQIPLRAISGSEITWFGDDAGFSRKFDLHPAVDSIFNPSAAQLDLTSVRGASTGTRTRLFPSADDEEADDQVLGAQDARLYSITDDQ